MTEPKKYYLLTSKLFFSQEEYEITTVLGSCVSVCLWDEKHKFGGMTHYLLPECSENCRENEAYGNKAIVKLLDIMFKAGSELKDIKAQIYGGANIFKNKNVSIGQKNIEIAEKILREFNIPIIDRNVGENYGRKIIFNNRKNLVNLKKLRPLTIISK